MTRHAPWAERPGGDFAIALKPIAAAEWFEGGEAAAETVARKTGLLRSAPALVWAQTPGSEAAQAEALALVEGWAGRPAPGEAPALWRAGLLVADDMCLMERVEGVWTLTALSLCAGSLFTAADVIGRPLEALHAPVPGFAERLLTRVTRIFDRLDADSVLMRRNWTVMASGDLHLPHAAPVRARVREMRPEQAGAELFLRVERQTLRRLPRSGGLLFSIRVWLDPVGSLTGESLAAFGRAWRRAGPEFRRYKGLEALDPLIEHVLACGEICPPAIPLTGEVAIENGGGEKG